MATASYKERQNDELQVLQAVFMGDFRDLRQKDAWKVGRPPEVSLTLKPQESFGNQSIESYVQVDLVFSLSANYPDVLPDIKLENSKGLSNQQLSTLNEDLTKQAQSFLGEEMLLQLSQIVQGYLYANNKPPPKSFYEEMMSNKKKEEERQAQVQMKKNELQRKKVEKEMLIVEEEIQKRKEALKEGTRKWREETRQASLDRETPTGTPTDSPIKFGSPKDGPFTRQSVSPSPVVISRQTGDQEGGKPARRRRTSTPRCGDDTTSQCKHHAGGIVELSFTSSKTERTVHMGTCLGHGLHGSTVYVGIDAKTGDLVAISEWVLKWRHVSRKNLMTSKPGEPDKEADIYRKQLLSIEQEMSSLLKLHHRNLLHYLAFKQQEGQGRITVYVLMEYSGGQNLDIYLTRKTLSMDVIRQYTEELLEALEYLHNKAVVHKNLRASSVFVDMNGRIRLADYSINKRLCDIFNMVEESKPGVKFTDNTSPGLGRGGKKCDIYQLGVLLLSLSQGSQVEELLPTIPSTLPPLLQDLLSKCLLKDDRLRWSSTQLLEHPFLKEPIPQHITHTQDHGGQGDNKGEKKECIYEEEEELHPFITAWEASGQSRLTNEFDVLKSLGKGGFGDVIKVKNKLDGRSYAIKRIPLNPKSQHFNRKITREVKLISRLNHENVVRYYNSWIETSDELASSDSSSSWSGTPKNVSESEKKVCLPSYFMKNSLDMTDDIEKLAPQMGTDDTQDFSISYEISMSRSRGYHGDSDSDSSDSECGEPDVFGMSFMDAKSDDSSDSIVFEHNFDEDNITTSLVDADKSKKDDTVEQSLISLPKQYLYIQMEYCEKSTLRNCIDVGLYQDTDRVWRLFREIVEGLLHVHEQGMIHRDLKPVNIFLDSNDHVKIGDFGLATSDIISKSGLKDNTLLMTSEADIHESMSRSGSLGDGNLTGRVGTALYVSPEMMTIRHNKITYSQKVDIYSLGIIFFEMCYKPLQTGMERVKILGHLRSEEIVFPEDFDPVEMENQCHILRWLLNHDPNQRPASKELLQSEYIPPPQMEEAELNEVLRSTISDPTSKSYHRMINAMFSQTVSLADDHVYDSDIHKGLFSVKSSLTHRLVHESLVKVFQRHGAVRLNTPLLIPRQKMYENVDQYTCLMDHSGRLVGLPFDLRVPFARYITRTNINNVKRYCIEKVYRKKKVSGFHPRELTECAFDIVTSSVSLIPDAEVIIVAQDIINEFTPLQQRNYYFRMNHTSLLKAVLLHAGISEDKHNSVLTVLSEAKRDMKVKLAALCHLSISEQSASMLLNLLEIEGPYNKVASILRTVTKTKGQAGSLAKQGLHELEAVITNAQHLGLKLPVTVSVGWIFNTNLYNGTIFQVTLDVVRKKKTVSEVLAAGGRYDQLIGEFGSRCGILSAPASKQSGIGVSIAFEKIVSALMEQEDYQPPAAYDILVCTIGRKPVLKERMNIVRDLWNAGLKADILHGTLEGQEEIQDFCRANGISQLVILKDSEGASVKVRSIEKEKITEKTVMTSLLVEFLQQKLQNNEIDQKPSPAMSGSKPSQTSQSHTDNIQQTPSLGSNIHVNFNFILQDGKLQSNTRRKYEALIVSKIKTSLPWLSMKCIEVVALDLTITAIRMIAAFLDVDSSESSFEDSIGTVVEKLIRYKKYMSKITDQIHQLVYENKCNCIVLYGIKDDSVKLLTSS